MNDFLKNIICEAGYSEERDGDVKYFGKKNEFFILKYFENEEFEDFFKSEKLDSLIEGFQSLKDGKIRKNSSLFVLVKVDSLSEFYNNHLKNIMDIEEDEYYFRKYVILYTEEGINKLEPNTQFLLQYIQSKDLEDQSLFAKFENNMFFEEAYFIAMQLIIKLPFISLPHASEHFKMIEDRIKLRIEEECAIKSEKKVNQIVDKLVSTDINQLLENNEIFDELNKILGDCSHED